MEIQITPLSKAVFTKKEINVITKARDLHLEKFEILRVLCDMGYLVDPGVFWREGGMTAEITFTVLTGQNG